MFFGTEVLVKRTRNPSYVFTFGRLERKSSFLNSMHFSSHIHSVFSASPRIRREVQWPGATWGLLILMIIKVVDNEGRSSFQLGLWYFETLVHSQFTLLIIPARDNRGAVGAGKEFLQLATECPVNYGFSCTTQWPASHYICLIYETNECPLESFMVK